MQVLTEKVKAKDLKAGDLFSTAGQEHWGLIDTLTAVGERVYIRTNTPCPTTQAEDEIYRITVIAGKNTVLISAFPGTGKSHFCHHSGMVYLDDGSKVWDWTSVTVTDSDSSKFDKKDFPQNYINHIKELMGKLDVICISTHSEVRHALVENGMPFTLVYPDIKLKEEYVQRFRDRGSPHTFITLLSMHWDNWIKQLMEQENCNHIVLKSGEYLADKFKGNRIQN